MKWVSVAALVVVLNLSGQSVQASSEGMIEQLTATIECTSSSAERARYLVYRARHYGKLGQLEDAENDYLDALDIKEHGWIWAELAVLYTNHKQYEKAHKAIHYVEDKFSHLNGDLANIAAVVEEELQKQYLEENPPEIVFDTRADTGYVSRVQLKNRALAEMTPLDTPVPVRKTVTRKKTYTRS